MSVVHCYKWKEEKPDWVSFSAFGPYDLKAGEEEPDYHFHDCDEYFFVTRGKAMVKLDGKDYPIGWGDCVCIKMGQRHRIHSVSEDLTLVWVYDELKGQKREGHIE